MADLTDDDRYLIARAREVGPVMRARDDLTDQQAGWLLKDLADLAERLAGQS